MKQFNIKSTADPGFEKKAADCIDSLTKPKGSLGRLEELALQICKIQKTLTPVLSHPCNILFAGDHGICEENVSPSPREVTWQQVVHFLHGTGGINFLCRQHGFRLMVVDSGVDHDLSAEKELVHLKVGNGTRNFLHGPAMTPEEMDLCLERGAACVDRIREEGSDIVSFGEMGVANTSPSSIWLSLFAGHPIEDCVGAGSGLDRNGISHKLQILKTAMEHFSAPHTPENIIAHFGGYEMVMAIGGMLRAAEQNMIILVDGFIMTACMIAASELYPDVLDYAIFGHQGDESGHRLALEYLHAKPLLNLGLRLGEGSGAVCSYPIVVSAVNMINQMDSFSSAAVTRYF